MRKIWIVPAIAAAALVAVLGGKGVYSYYSGTAQTASTANVSVVNGGAKVGTDAGAVTLSDSKFNEEKAKKIQPGGMMPFAPTAKSNAEYTGWAILRVEVPKILAKVTENEQPKYYTMYTISGVDKNKWTLLGSDNVDTQDGGQSTKNPAVYYFGYNTTLGKGNTTSDLCDALTEKPFIYVAEDSSVKLQSKIVVKAAFVQSETNSTIQDAFSRVGHFDTDSNGQFITKKAENY